MLIHMPFQCFKKIALRFGVNCFPVANAVLDELMSCCLSPFASHHEKEKHTCVTTCNVCFNLVTELYSLSMLNAGM